jgi:parallel beta-helix repeat protein
MSRRNHKSRWNRMTCSATPYRAAARRHRFHFEPLEDRRMLATMVVDTTSSLSNHFNTISAAVAAAHNGDTINVAAGIYNESVDVNKSLTIIGGKPNFNFFLTGQHFASTVDPGALAQGFILDASNITIKNFNIQDAAAGITSSATPFSGFNLSNNKFLNCVQGIVLDTSLTKANKTSTISGNIFTNDSNAAHGGASIYGIAIPTAARNVVISNNSFFAQQSYAVFVEGSSVSSNVQILNNVITNLQEDMEAGITVYNLAGSKINGNTIFDPTTTAIELAGNVTNTQVENNSLSDFGAGAQNVSAIVLNENFVATADSGNTISGNSIQGFVDAIVLVNASSNKVLSNECSSQTNVGIAISNSSSNTLTSNTVTSSQTVGISLVQGSSNTLSGNVVSDCVSDGIQLTSTSGDTLSSNVVKFNAGEGFKVSQSSSNKFTSNTAKQNEEDGFLVQTSNSNTFTSNTCNSNLGDGFVTSDDVSSSTFTTNTANNNGSFGFNIGGGATISGNHANGNYAGGMLLESGHFNLKGNTTSGNLGFGISFFEATGQIISNTVSNNGGDGIFLDESTGSTVSSNTVKNNGSNGIHLDDQSTGNSITKNTATGNGVFGGFDLKDESTGAGTDGTANTWSHNTFDISHPVALD